MYTKLKQTIVALFTAILIGIPVFVTAQPDAPVIVEWKGGVPYDADGDMIKTKNGKRWCYDSTKDPQEFILVDDDYNVLESRVELGIEDPTDHEEGVNIKVSDDDVYGWITLQADVPEDADGKDVLVSLQGDGGSGDYRLLKQNNYETTIQLPVGTYRVESARIDGDLALTYGCDYNEEATVLENDGTNLYFAFEKGTLLNAGKNEAAVIQEEEENNNQHVTAAMIILYVLFGTIALFATILIVLLIRKAKGL